MRAERLALAVWLWLALAGADLRAAGESAEDPPAGPSPADAVEAPTPWGVRQLAHDTRFLITSPARLDHQDRVRLAIAGGIAGGLYFSRHEIRDFVQDHRSAGRGRLLDGVRTMGKGAFAPSVALASYLASLVTRNDREKETALLVLESYGFSAMAAGAGQIVLATERPETGSKVRLFHSGGHGISGDAALAASVVPPLRRQYLRVQPEDRPWLRFWKRAATGALYAGVALTAYQRLYQDKHWAPDAFLGAATGLAVGEILCDAHEQSRLGSVRGSPAPQAAPTAFAGTRLSDPQR